MKDIVPKRAYNGREREKMNQICRYDLFFGWLAGQVMKLGLQGQMGNFGVRMGLAGKQNGPFKDPKRALK